MSLISRLMQGLAGTGAHRAADRIPALETDRDYWQAVALEAQAKLEHADALMIRCCEEKSAALIQAARLAAELDVVTEGHRLLEQENDQLAARLIEIRAELANRRAISSPAPADCGPAIPLPRYDPDATHELSVTTLQYALGLRPNARAKTAA